MNTGYTRSRLLKVNLLLNKQQKIIFLEKIIYLFIYIFIYDEIHTKGIKSLIVISKLMTSQAVFSIHLSRELFSNLIII